MTSYKKMLTTILLVAILSGCSKPDTTSTAVVEPTDTTVIRQIAIIKRAPPDIATPPLPINIQAENPFGFELLGYVEPCREMIKSAIQLPNTFREKLTSTKVRKSINGDVVVTIAFFEKNEFDEDVSSAARCTFPQNGVATVDILPK